MLSRSGGLSKSRARGHRCGDCAGAAGARRRLCASAVVKRALCAGAVPSPGRPPPLAQARCVAAAGRSRRPSVPARPRAAMAALRVQLASRLAASTRGRASFPRAALHGSAPRPGPRVALVGGRGPSPGTRPQIARAPRPRGAPDPARPAGAVRLRRVRRDRDPRGLRVGARAGPAREEQGALGGLARPSLGSAGGEAGTRMSPEPSRTAQAPQLPEPARQGPRLRVCS